MYCSVFYLHSCEDILDPDTKHRHLSQHRSETQKWTGQVTEEKNLIDLTISGSTLLFLHMSINLFATNMITANAPYFSRRYPTVYASIDDSTGSSTELKKNKHDSLSVYLSVCLVHTLWSHWEVFQSEHCHLQMSFPLLNNHRAHTIAPSSGNALLVLWMPTWENTLWQLAWPLHAS